MNELRLLDKCLMDGLGCKEVIAHPAAQSLIIEQDLQAAVCLRD